MYPKLLPLLATILLSFSLQAQSPCQPILNQAQAALNSGDTEQALRKLQDVEICDDGNALIRQRQRLQNAIFQLINTQKQEAILARAEADSALALVRQEKIRTQEALDQAQKLIDAFYFYDGKYALAFSREFYFIDKEGEEIKKLHRWKAADQFDQRGFARVQDRNQINYLLDTLGRKFRLATSLDEINEETKFIEIKDLIVQDTFVSLIKRSKQLFGLVVENTFLNEEQSKKLFSTLVQLSNLKYLSFKQCHFEYLPPSIRELQNLKILNLEQCDLPNALQEISYLQGLEHLKLMGLDTLIIPESISNLTHLKSFEVSAYVLDTLPASFYNLVALEKLYLHIYGLNSLPAGIGKLQQLKDLNLDYTNIADLPPDIVELDNLTHFTPARHLHELPSILAEIKNLQVINLETYSGKIQCPIELFKLTELVELDYTNDTISVLPALIGKMIKLRKLTLHCPNLKSLPSELFELTELEELTILTNYEVALPAGLSQLQKLRILNINHQTVLRKLNPASDILKEDAVQSELSFSEICELSNLRELYVGSRLLKHLPVEIGNLKKLETLVLSCDSLSALPGSFGQLNKLHTLVIKNSQLSQLPNEFAQLIKLEELYISQAKFEAFPSEICELKELKKLQFSNTLINNLPVTIGKMQNLEYLQLANNKLTHLPTEIGKLVSLNELLLYRNNLTELPASLGNLSVLEILRADENLITQLPSALTNLPQLVVLDLTYNKLKSFPQVIEGWRKLQYLKLGNNQLAEISPAIGQLQELSALHLSNNELNNLPADLNLLVNLFELRLQSNRLTSFSEGLLRLPSLYILDLSDNLIQETPSNLSGDSNLNRLILDNNRISTIDILEFADQIPNSHVSPSFYQTIQGYRTNGDYTAIYNLYRGFKLIKEPNNPRHWYDYCVYSLYSGNYNTAIEAAGKTLELDPEKTQVYTHLAMAYLFNGQWHNAESILQEWKGKPFWENGPIADISILSNLDELEAAGITHPDFAKVRAIFE